ncbi:octaprenyl pyrophosphate synthase, putative [Plasmodium knowlesi strain H]|uniref:Octaprenyl pyrophosphate synthase, putative n=3 Tax=Plasmodium knowlesi TaxID=5850 RepID=A0A5K1UIE5_PLAKH|nr:octaprenyl pyrophosphate synthase, putative [Plasmodium knowlesi strain H]OTN66766.1 putative Octaprenyl pyrophosphate synthase [Plasmodium knowlesi]CAA9986822.1 octaprenyl pyrophosphate synthase, putative [Plasmodium knowlesi strain H]SBO23670.1 octaprenyl pyrophosphate synthase, putative [Plasmodium knowlesi strain H]SBO25243.1 octaprenyl pyrophosphate synthase, putative [Plasmodium knowlesi strain H]VVS76296.1 octaprenyl pyrophosphate synthase, putative [Plasmodium knowlesi strain H]|eukprot:XP_002258006.1 polyprenyl synthetase, putative [Plasmodium knowlesi strain H]
MILLSRKKNIKEFLNYCKRKCLNSLLTNKNDDPIKGVLPWRRNGILLDKGKNSNFLVELLKSYPIKLTGNYIKNKISSDIHKIAFDTCGIGNTKYSENMYEEILLCMKVLTYEDEQVEKELTSLQDYFKNIKSGIDPYILCENKIKNIDEHIYNIIKTDYNNLDEFITYIYHYQGKKFRVILSILLKSILCYVDNVSSKNNFKFRNIQRNYSKSVKSTNSANNIIAKKKLAIINYASNNISKKEIGVNQCRIIAASEIIHMGSLLHDDVIDDSNNRRGALALHKKYGNKISILSGDFLLARASSVFASIGCPQICKRFAYVVESLIKGELLQTNLKFNNIEDALKTYFIKTYHKTASLFSHLFACMAILSFKNEKIINLCFNLGLHIGMAFQLYDDYLDYKPDKKTNKPILNDLNNSIKTAPFLFSYNYNPDVVLSLINKKTLSDTDINNILFYIHSTNSLKKNELCSLLHIKRAADILISIISYCRMPKNAEKANSQRNDINQSREALINLVLNILSRGAK